MGDLPKGVTDAELVEQQKGKHEIVLIPEDLIPQSIKTGVKPSLEPRRRYWLGTKERCPVKDVHLAGVTFTRRTGVGEGRAGEVVELTDTQVRDIRDRMRHKIARWNAGIGSIADDRAANFEPMEGDEPMAAFLYMIPEDIAAEVVGAYEFRDAEPPSILELAKKGQDERAWKKGLPVEAPKHKAEVAKLSNEIQAQQAEIRRLTDLLDQKAKADKAAADKAAAGKDPHAGEELPEGDPEDANPAPAIPAPEDVAPAGMTEAPTTESEPELVAEAEEGGATSPPISATSEKQGPRIMDLDAIEREEAALEGKGSAGDKAKKPNGPATVRGRRR